MKMPNLFGEDKYEVVIGPLRGKQPETIIKAALEVLKVVQPLEIASVPIEESNKKATATYMRYDMTKDQYLEIRRVLGAEEIELPEWPDEKEIKEI